MYSELAYQNEALIDQFIELLDKNDYEVRETLSEWNYKKFKLLEPALMQIRGTKIRYIHHSEFNTDVYIFENSKEVRFLPKKFETNSLDSNFISAHNRMAGKYGGNQRHLEKNCRILHLDRFLFRI